MANPYEHQWVLFWYVVTRHGMSSRSEDQFNPTLPQIPNPVTESPAPFCYNPKV
jgi:hypothetical protein